MGREGKEMGRERSTWGRGVPSYATDHKRVSRGLSATTMNAMFAILPAARRVKSAERDGAQRNESSHEESEQNAHSHCQYSSINSFIFGQPASNV